jgi:hypothetical protein
VNVDETERAELIAALHQAATFGERLLNLNERLLNALATGENRLNPAELEYLRAGLSRWREQISTLRQRIAGLTIVPPEQDAVGATPAERRWTRTDSEMVGWSEGIPTSAGSRGGNAQHLGSTGQQRPYCSSVMPWAVNTVRSAGVASTMRQPTFSIGASVHLARSAGPIVTASGADGPSGTMRASTRSPVDGIWMITVMRSAGTVFRQSLTTYGRSCSARPPQNGGRDGQATRL